jgi:hypothetical protein
MRGRIGFFAAGCPVLLLASHLFAADVTVVARFDGVRQMQFGLRPRLVLSVQTVAGQRLEIGVPNIKDDQPKLDPVKDRVDEIKAVQPGDIVKLTYSQPEEKKPENVLEMVRMLPYPMLPGMELPNAFVFHEMYDHTDAQKTQTLVDAKKFDDMITFCLALKKDATGSMVADPDLVAALGKIKPGQVVLIDAAGGSPHPIIHSVEVYNAPQTGTIKAIKPAELNGNKTTEADIDVDGSPITVLVPGRLEGKRWILDTKVQSLLRRFKAGSLVVFRTIDDNGTTLLRDIKAAPKPEAPVKTAAGK